MKARGRARVEVQRSLAHKKTAPPPLGPPYDPTVGSYGGGGSYERVTPVAAEEEGGLDGDAVV